MSKRQAQKMDAPKIDFCFSQLSSGGGRLSAGEKKLTQRRGGSEEFFLWVRKKNRDEQDEGDGVCWCEKVLMAEENGERAHLACVRLASCQTVLVRSDWSWVGLFGLPEGIGVRWSVGVLRRQGCRRTHARCVRSPLQGVALWAEGAARGGAGEMKKAVPGGTALGWEG